MTLQETLARLNWGGKGYADYQGYAKIGDVFNLLSSTTGQEKSAWNQLGFETSTMNTWMIKQYSEMQDLLRPLSAQLQQMATNPQGFGAMALSQMKGQLIQNVGTNYASQLQNLQQNFASQNLAGLGSGVQQAIAANLAQGAAGQEASGLNAINLANAQQQMQQQQFALGMAPQMAGALGALPQSADLAAQLTQTEGTEAYNLAGQGSLMKNIISGVIGMGLNMAVPGAGTLLSGAMSGAQQPRAPLAMPPIGSTG